MGTLYVDGQSISFISGQKVIQAVLRAGIDIPYFCYHEALGSAGSCRLCAMELEAMNESTSSRVIMACMQLAQDGQRYRLIGGRAGRVRKNIIEYYMTRHPHDCPVCDEAGECRLQDMTILSGHAYRRYDGKKRTFSNQDMGPLIWNSANRCITCYRCVRFYQNYALGDDFGVYGSGQCTTFRRADAGAFDSPFSGNLINVCPTGTFTDKVYRRKYARTWQLERAPSICHHCSVGCNTEPGGRLGTLRRVHSRENTKVNPHFICDRGRYGEHFSEAKTRPMQCLLHGQPHTEDDVFAYLTERLKEARGCLGVLSAPNEDIEAYCALRHMARHYEGIFSPFLSVQDEMLIRAAIKASIQPPSLHEIEQADGALVIGSLTEAAPMMDLAVRQLLAKNKPVHMVHAAPSLLADLIRKKSMDHVSLLAPQFWSFVISGMNVTETSAEIGPNVFADLESGCRIVILGVVAEMDVTSILALHDLAQSLVSKQLHVKLGFAFEGANAVGAAMMGTHCSAQVMLDAIRAGSIDTLLVCGADPFGKSASVWKALRGYIRTLIVLDNVATTTVHEADVVVPLATWSERCGITVNYEGRLQAFECAYQRDCVYSVTTFVAKLLSLTLDAMSCERDHWVMEKIGKIVLPGGCGEKINFNNMDWQVRAEEKNEQKSHGVQMIRLSWHGEGDKADYAEALSLNKPWHDTCVYMHPDTAQSINISTGQWLHLGGDQAFCVVLDQRLAKECFGVTLRALTWVGYAINTVLPASTLCATGV